MKTVLFLITIILATSFLACNQTGKKKPETINETQNADTITKSKTIKNNQILAKQNELTHIDSFLLKPFDLYNFKKKKGGTNSGGCNKKSYFFKPVFKPDLKGMYYSFFLFPPLKGYIGNSKDKIVKMMDGLEITTYKPLGKYQNKYLDPEEILIEVIAQYNDFDLPELAFIGLDTIEIKKQLGGNYFVKNGCMVYSHSDRALIFGLQKSKIKWLKYVHLNTPLTPDVKLEDIYKCKVINHGW